MTTEKRDLYIQCGDDHSEGRFPGRQALIGFLFDYARVDVSQYAKESYAETIKMKCGMCLS